MDYTNIRFEKKDGIGIITLNRPQALNSLSVGLLRELNAAMDDMELDSSILGVILTGEGRAFCAGADLSGKDTAGSAANPIENTKDRIRWVHSTFNRLENFQRPVIAAINGFALGGGCELAMCCDIRIASEKAVFGQPEVGLGGIACYGGPQRLPRLVGVGVAKELLYTGRKIKADVAKEIGLVNKVVPADQLMAEADALIKTIMAQAPIAVKYTKVCVNRGLELPLDYALELELNMVAMCVATEDAKEGGKAFVERRAPKFSNR